MLLPTRVHDLLLDFAGRVDDDALADARELLAAAEVDRCLEFLVGCLVAGRIAITTDQHDEIEALFEQVYLDSAVIERLVVDDSSATIRHKFGGEEIDGETAGDGVADAARRVLDVLPDVRSVWAVWRLTPAGAASGPVPHRVILVGVGPSGFAPATAYRMEHALRRAGMRASVEVLRDGTDAPDYHHAAMQHASQVPFARQAPTNPTPVRPRTTVVPVVTSAPEPAPSSGRRARIEPAEEPSPAPKATDTTQLSQRARQEPPADPLASAKPSPAPRPAPAAPAPVPAPNPVPVPAPAKPEPPASSWLNAPESTTPKLKPVNGQGESLSDQEKHLLQQLQDELARREQEETDGHLLGGAGRQEPPHVYDWQNPGGPSIILNGVPPQQGDQRR
jgi:hypothetical protein